MEPLRAIPDEAWPLAPKEEPAMGVFIMDRGKLNPPLSRSEYKLQTDWLVRFENSLFMTAVVQLAKPVQ